jgi:hypothetical protein
MAESQFVLHSGSVALSTTAKTVAAVLLGATVAAELTELIISTDATITTGQYLFEIVTYTTDGTGTAGTIIKDGISQGSTTATAKTNYTAEPSGTVTTRRQLWVPAQNAVQFEWPLGRGLFIPVSTLFGVRATAPSGTPNMRTDMIWVE